MRNDMVVAGTEKTTRCQPAIIGVSSSLMVYVTVLRSRLNSQSESMGIIGIGSGSNTAPL